MARPKVSPPLASPDDIEQQFYEALQHADIERLMAVWSDDEEVVCVLPGGPRLVGTGAIRAAFEEVFGHGAVNAQPHKVRRLQTHACSVHSVLVQVRIETLEGAQQAWVIATNVFVKGAQGWRLVAHHASPGAVSEVQEMVEAASSVLH